ncbi:MAG TPA: FG-GAP-like repeat-containing protein [Terriglobales bacterium]|nr:FG-GAP-like repeat-containing protein [Terriglobales bacterium]
MRRTNRTSLALFSTIIVAAFIFLAAQPKNPTEKSDTKNLEAARLNNLGVAYMNQQLFEKALKSFDQAAALDPKMEVAQINRGIALLNLQQFDKAKAILLEAVKRAPHDPHAWYNLGLFYKNTNDNEAAADAFRHVTEIDPNDADTWYFLGAVYAQGKQFPQAVASFEHALKLNPLHASAEFGLSRAYQQSGDTEHAREHVKQFQHITQNKLGSPVSLAYGEQGKYSRAEESPAFAEKVSPAIPVRFVDVTKEAGLASKPVTPESNDLASFLGSGACFLDYDNDGKLDIFLADNGPQGGLALFHNVGDGKFENVTKKAGLDPTLHAIGCTAGDYDNDGAEDLAVSFDGRVLLLHNEKNGTFEDVTQAAGIRSEGLNTGLTFIDYDHDGDLDLYVTRFVNGPSPGAAGAIAVPSGTTVPANNLMFRNNGNGTFTDVTGNTALYADPSLAAVGTDYNNDRAIDLVLADLKGPTIFQNPREGKFLPQTPWEKPVPHAVGVSVLDFNHDGWMDIAFTHDSKPGISLWRNREGKTFEPVSLPSTNWVRGWGVAALDYDNDGWIDLVALGETADGKGEVRLFRNQGPDGFRDVTSDVGLDKISLKNPRSVIVGDYDDDGSTDLLITQNHGPAVLLRNEGGNRNNWLRISLKGLNDNKSAIGTKVEVFAGANRQKWEIYGGSGYLGQNSTEIIAGLGAAKQADVVRMLWPTGVLQDEVEIAANHAQTFTEIDRRGSSCPTLFVWDGRHYELVSDMLGAGVVGHWVGPGQRNIPRPTEYVKLDSGAIKAKDGTLSFRLMEPMEEVVYLDHVGLLAVDHPRDLDVYPNEYFASNPPYPEFKVITSRNARPPAGAWDDHGHNVLPDLLAHRYFGDFELLPFKGFAKPHSLELDLGEPYQGGPLRLLMHGEIEYFTATGMYAADQAGIQATAPYVEAQDAHGNWTRVIDDMGFPAGLPRTMVADLSGKIPRGTWRIRISTNLQIYWDNILIDRTRNNEPSGKLSDYRMTSVPLIGADLRFHGYPRQIEDKPAGNVKYVYEQVSGTGPYARQAGAYTRYGNVRPLLAEFDDRVVVFGSGEEVALEFDPASLPALPPGWVRDYFFLANGYEKDMDFYAAEGNTVDPLPFAAMGTYPYPEKSYPLDDRHLNYLLEYNTRFVSGNEPRGYWYDFHPPR